MKKIVWQSSILFLVIVSMACSKEDTLRGSGNIITESRDVTSFTQVYNPTSVNVIIREGVSLSVELAADDNIISSVKTIVENGILKIDLSKSSYVDVTITVSVVVPVLSGLTNTGSGNMTVSDFEDLASLEINNEGSGNITLSGSGSSLTVKNLGSASYKGFGFVVNNCTVLNAGSGSCEINCSGELSGSNSSSGSIFYKGSPMVDVSNTGSGKVEDSN